MREYASLRPTPSFDPNSKHDTYEKWLARFKRNLKLYLRADLYQHLVDKGMLCHNYFDVDTGQQCCRGCGPVRVKSSGIGCKCGHTWFCW